MLFLFFLSFFCFSLARSRGLHAPRNLSPTGQVYRVTTGGNLERQEVDKQLRPTNRKNMNAFLRPARLSKVQAVRPVPYINVLFTRLPRSILSFPRSSCFPHIHGTRASNRKTRKQIYDRSGFASLFYLLPISIPLFD